MSDKVHKRQVKGKSKATSKAHPENEAAEAPGAWAEAWATSESRRASRRVKVNTRGAKECARDSSHSGPFYRHHKGFDSFVGRWNKSILFRYYQWLDCVTLCEDCHCAVHYLYEPYVSKWRNRSAAGAVNFRLKLISLCDEWLCNKRPTPKVPKEYRRQFHLNLVSWQREREKRGTG